MTGKRALRKLFSKEQRALFAAHAPDGIALDDLSILGPIFVLKLKYLPEGFARKMVAEMWLYPDGSRIFELSTKCAPAEAFQVAAETRAFLASKGVDLDTEQQTKTRTALEFFAQNRSKAPAPPDEADVAAHDDRLDLYLVRHAFAAHADPARWPDDAARPLTEEGIARFRVAARGLRRLVPAVDSMLSSGYARAWQTAELLHEVAGWPEPEECPALEAGRPATSVLDVLQGRSERSIALVGHEPHLSMLASLLCTGSEDAARARAEEGRRRVALVRRPGRAGTGVPALDRSRRRSSAGSTRRHRDKWDSWAALRKAT